MIIARSPQSLAAELDPLRYRGGARRCVSLVTTRGNFHEGHGTVMNAARTVSDVVVVAIAPTSERPVDNVVTATEFQDIGFVERHKADVLYIPSEDELFPTGSEDAMGVTLPDTIYPPCCGQLQDEHGLAAIDGRRLTVNLKMINTTQPDIIVWGEKNFVEYHTVRKLVMDLDIRAQVQCIPTVRHANGVALSSHDNILSAEDRDRAPILFETLNNAAHAIRTGARHYEKIEKTARLALRGAGFDIESFRILDEDSLAPASENTESYRIIGHVALSGIPIVDSIGLTL